MSYPCEAGCGRYFSRPQSAFSHVTSSKSCKWYANLVLIAPSKDLPAVREGAILQQHPAQVSLDDSWDNYDPQRDQDLTDLDLEIQDLNIGGEFHFIPREHPSSTSNPSEEQAGPGPQTAANRIRQAVESGRQLHQPLILDDDNDDRVTVVNQDAGKVRRKENPPSFQPPQPSDQHGDVSMDPPSNFYPFNSELDWRVAQWAVQDNPGQNALDRLLSIPGVCLFLSDLFMQMLMLYP